MNTPVGNLTRQDFRVFEDGAEQPLSDLSLRKVPVDVVLIVDASSSVAGNLDDFRRAAEGFAAHLAAEDRVSLIQFDDRVVLLQDWTRSLAQLRRALREVQLGKAVHRARRRNTNESGLAAAAIPCIQQQTRSRDVHPVDHRWH